MLKQLGITMKLIILCCSLILMAVSFFASSTEQTITLKLGKPSIQGIPKNYYILALLEKSFAEVNVKLNIAYSIEPMNTKRILQELKRNGDVDLAWLTMPSALAEQRYLIHTSYPIYNGLHSKRLLMVKQSRLKEFSEIKTLAQLKPFIALQKQSWSDFYVLKNNGLTVNGDLSYESMLKALDEGLGDYFPRSVTAIKAEIRKHPQYNFVIEPHIMLQYDNYYYFYANENNKAIIELLEQGLTKLADSGELNALYGRYYHDVEDGLNLNNRQVFNLKN